MILRLNFWGNAYILEMQSFYRKLTFDSLLRTLLNMETEQI